MAVVESRSRPFNPWAPEIYAMLANPSPLQTYRSVSPSPSWYFRRRGFGWAVELNRDGTVTLIVNDDSCAQYTFPTLQQAYLTGCLLFPDTFPTPWSLSDHQHT